MNTVAPSPYVFSLPLAAVVFDVYCLFELWRVRDTNHLTKSEWAAAICFLTPFGGISFLMLGKASEG